MGNRWNDMAGPGTMSTAVALDPDRQPAAVGKTAESDWRERSRIGLRGTTSMPSLPAARGTVDVTAHTHMMTLRPSEVAARQWHKPMHHQAVSDLRDHIGVGAKSTSKRSTV